MAKPLTVANALDELSTARIRGHRDSNEIVRKGLFVLEQKNGLKQLGENVWDFLEQLTIAALDIGQLELADDCIHRLDLQFPSSPRVELLQGLRLEAQDASLSTALKYYDQILEKDDTNVAVWKRRISVLRQQNKLDLCVRELIDFLDTFYSDLEGWLELADLYATLNQYSRSLQALSHAQLLAPQNPFHSLHFAETAYTANDIPLALSYFLRTVELTDPTSEEHGVGRRAWFGVKLSVRRLLSTTSPLPSESKTAVPPAKNLRLLDELATERLSGLYSSAQAKGKAPGRVEVLKWLSAKY